MSNTVVRTLYLALYLIYNTHEIRNTANRVDPSRKSHELVQMRNWSAQIGRRDSNISREKLLLKKAFCFIFCAFFGFLSQKNDSTFCRCVDKKSDDDQHEHERPSVVICGSYPRTALCHCHDVTSHPPNATSLWGMRKRATGSVQSLPVRHIDHHWEKKNRKIH